MGLRYRYFAWLEKKLHTFMAIIENDHQDMSWFIPEKTYSFADQIMMSIFVPMLAFAIPFVLLSRVLGQKLRVSNVTDESSANPKA